MNDRDLTFAQNLEGCLTGIAVGDSMGLPAEKLSRRRISTWYPGPWRQCLIGSWGMCSDDTEHSFLLAQALLKSKGDVNRFRSSLGWKLRWWFLAIPAGIGRATVRACLKLWIGFSSKHSGVPSAGNGPSMRAPLIGAYFHDDAKARHEHLAASTALTHVDPIAEIAAECVAELAAALIHQEFQAEEWLHHQLSQMETDNDPWYLTMKTVEKWLKEDRDLDHLAQDLNIEHGVSGYSLHTTPMAIATTLKYLNDPANGLEGLFRCGGDTDTTCAIAGGLMGIHHGPSCWPTEWLTHIHNGPLSMKVVNKAAQHLAEDKAPVRWMWPLVPLRNIIFLLIVLAHGFRRLLP